MEIFCELSPGKQGVSETLPLRFTTVVAFCHYYDRSIFRMTGSLGIGLAPIIGPRLRENQGDKRQSAVFCGFLRFSAVFCGFLQKSAVSCENLRFPAKICISQMLCFPGKGENLRENLRESARICEYLRLGSVCPLRFAPLSAS